jgi:hypothetical protein
MACNALHECDGGFFTIPQWTSASRNFSEASVSVRVSVEQTVLTTISAALIFLAQPQPRCLARSCTGLGAHPCTGVRSPAVVVQHSLVLGAS